MRGIPVMLLLAGAAGAQEWKFPKEPTPVRPLEFEVAVPEGWTAEQDHTGLVARDKQRNGFLVSREPLLHDPKRFADAWAAQLGQAELTRKIENGKAGRLQAWHASWTAKDAGRRIEVWRVHVPQNEMLYNFSFSAPPGVDVKPLVDGVLKSFSCTAPKPELKLAPTAVSAGTSFTLRLPQGYDQAPGRGLHLGEIALYYDDLWLKYLPGYKEPHLAGRIAVRSFTADRAIGLPSGKVIQPSNEEDVAESWWELAEKPDLGSVEGRPRTRSARYGGVKGAAVEASGLSKQGLPKEIYVWAGKEKQNLVIVSITVDARETRLHKDLFKEICSTLQYTR